MLIYDGYVRRLLHCLMPLVDSEVLPGSCRRALVAASSLPCITLLVIAISLPGHCRDLLFLFLPVHGLIVCFTLGPVLTPLVLPVLSLLAAIVLHIVVLPPRLFAVERPSSVLVLAAVVVVDHSAALFLHTSSAEVDLAISFPIASPFKH